MFEPNIESNVICPKCGWKWIFNDMAYVNHLSEWGIPMSCPKCKHKFRVKKSNTKHTHKPTNSNIIVKEAEETKKKILSLMERIGEDIECFSINNTSEYQDFAPVSYNTEITLSNGRKTKSYVGISNGISTFHIASDDGCYVVYHKDNESPDGRMSEEPCNHLQPFIIQELKKLPNSPV